jgi:hypothetical protein
MDEIDSIFDGLNSAQDEHVEIANEAPVEETVVEEASEAPETETVEEAPAEVAEEEGSKEDKSKAPVPLATFLDMRDKMKEHKAEAELLRRRVEEFEASKNQSAPSIPDPSIDPRGFAQAYASQIDAQMFEQRLNIYGDMAVKQHGEDTVTKAVAWAEERLKVDPSFGEQFRASRNPVAFIIEQQQQQETLDLMRTDPKAYARRIAEEEGWLVPVADQTVSPTTTKPTAKKPTTLSSIPSASANTPSDKSEKENLDALFNR